MLTLQELSFSYAHRRAPALVGVSAELDASLVAVLGPNGAGKSTLLRILATAAAPTSGTFALDGVRVTGRGRRSYRQQLGWMPQHLGMFGGWTCAEFLRYVAWMRQVPAARLEEAVQTALEVVNLGARSDAQVKALSGGMRQRLGLAQAVVGSPRVLLLDEPTVGLDPRERSEFRAYLVDLSLRCQVLVSTHLVDDVAVLARQVLVLSAGSVAFAGSLEAMCGQTDPSASRVEASYLDLVPASAR